ncbi:MAG: molybdopterin molybdotransferase MoeA [Desulfurococcaceae archaeon]
MKKIERLVPLDEAINKLVNTMNETIKLDLECVSLLNATNRIAAINIYAELDKPERDMSAVDGYAIRSIDTISASQYSPVELRIITKVIRPGIGVDNILMEPGTAIRVHTGGFIPGEADAVVMDEDVEIIGDKLLVYKPVSTGLNVIQKGEDFRKGELLVERGQVITPSIIASLASQGVDRIKVYRKINVSIMAIGDELVEPGVELNKGVYNTTAYLVYSLLQRDAIFNVKYSGILPDNKEELEDRILREFENGADLVITTGGTGISESDIVSDLYDNEKRFIFRGIRLRPGRPTSSFVYKGRLVINVSGFPVAAWAGIEVLFRKAVIKWLGIKGLERKIVDAVLTRRVPNNVGYNSVIRVLLGRQGDLLYAEPYMIRGSGVISSLLRTNGYIIIPEDVEGFEKGTVVKVYLYD